MFDMKEVKRLSLLYPVDNVIHVIIHICFGVQCVASLPMIIVSFQEQVSKRHKVFFFKGDHHFVAQSKRD